MPLVICYGLNSDDFEEKRVVKLEATILGVMVKMEEFFLGSKDISFSFPKDPTITSNAVDLIIVVDFLFNKPERNIHARQRMATFIAKSVKKLPGNENRKIEVLVRRFDPKQEGFFSIEP